MNAATVLLILVAGLADGQLNFEGNPLTENTEYTAMESRSSERTVRQQETATNVTNTSTKSSQANRPSISDAKNFTVYANPTRTLIDRDFVNREALIPTINQEEIAQSARHLSSNTYDQGVGSTNPAEVALNSFLNSKTPEESRMSLDYYLQSRESPEDVQSMLVNQQQLSQQTAPPVNQQQLSQQAAPPVNQQQLSQQAAPPVNQQPVSSTVNQHLTAQLMQQRKAFQAFPVNNLPTYNAPVNQVDLHSTVANPVVMPPMQQQVPYATATNARNDIVYPGWYQGMRRVRGKPYSYAQSRVGPGLFGGPVPPALPYKPKGPPLEVIYTKPPGFHRGPPTVSNPPVPYEDASAWFPEADQPPPAKDVFYSQLYSQSYDPFYYNYIAKTGKIKPHLYGKFGKYHEEEGDGIWADLYRGFKKHGLKNMMTPTFLLGITLPVITLMLTALVQKRSLARSDSREFSQEDKIQEYLEQIQRAVECYEKRRRKRDGNADECWS